MHSEKEKKNKGKAGYAVGHTSLTSNSQYRNHLMKELTQCKALTHRNTGNCYQLQHLYPLLNKL